LQLSSISKYHYEDFSYSNDIARHCNKSPFVGQNDLSFNLEYQLIAIAILRCFTALVSTTHLFGTIFSPPPVMDIFGEATNALVPLVELVRGSEVNNAD
jgi:hypothetical protein